MKRTLVAFAIFALFLLAGHVALGLSRPLAFFILAQDHGAPGGLIDRYLLGCCSDHALWSKSSLVNVRGGAAADIDEPINRLFIGERNWKFSPRSVIEYVLVSDKTSQPYNRNPGAEVVVIFTPEHIAFVDFGRKESGRFKRVNAGERGPK